MQSAITEMETYLWIKSNGRWYFNPNFYLTRLLWNGGKVKILTKCIILRDTNHPDLMDTMKNASEVVVSYACSGVPLDRPYHHTAIGVMELAELSRYWTTLPANDFSKSDALSFHYEFSGDYQPLDNVPFEDIYE